MKKPSLKHIPLGLLIVYLVRSLILNSVTINDVLLMGVLAALTAFYEMQLESSKIAKLNEQIKAIETHNKQQDDIIQAVRDSLSAFKVGSSLKNVR